MINKEDIVTIIENHAESIDGNKCEIKPSGF